MKASIYTPERQFPQFRLAVSVEELQHLAAGLRNPKAIIEGDVNTGLLIRFDEHKGSQIKVYGDGSAEFRCPARHVQAASKKIAITEIACHLDRDGTGPILRTGRFPEEFTTAAAVKKHAATAVQPPGFEPQPEIVIRRRQPETALGEAFKKAQRPSPPEPSEPEPPAAPPPAVPQAAPQPADAPPQPTSASLEDLKMAIEMVNEALDLIGPDVVLVIENNRLKARRKKIVLEDLI